MSGGGGKAQPLAGCAHLDFAIAKARGNRLIRKHLWMGAKSEFEDAPMRHDGEGRFGPAGTQSHVLATIIRGLR